VIKSESTLEGGDLSTKLERILNLLGDNVWHNVDEVAKTLEIPQDRLQQVIVSLTETDLIQHNSATNQIKLSQSWKTLITNPKETDPGTQPGTPAVGTIIMPPQQTLIVQCTRITNLTDSSLELEMRMDKRIREIAINKIQ
jgi:hypothetical protein